MAVLLSLFKINAIKMGKIQKIKVDEFDEILIKQLKRNKYFTIPQLADVTGKSNATIHRYLSRMMDSGILERIGSRKTGYWKIK